MLQDGKSRFLIFQRIEPPDSGTDPPAPSQLLAIFVSLSGICRGGIFTAMRSAAYRVQFIPYNARAMHDSAEP